LLESQKRPGHLEDSVYARKAVLGQLGKAS